MTDLLREPTSDECTANALLYEQDGVRAFACWYPQMGGYVGKAVIEVTTADACFEVYVWHDGTFPFGDPEEPHEPWDSLTQPAHLHHCMAEQFIRFGQLVEKLAGGPPAPMNHERLCNLIREAAAEGLLHADVNEDRLADWFLPRLGGV